MWGIFRRGSLLGDDLTNWQFDTVGWLLRHMGGIDGMRERRVVTPTPMDFPQSGLRGHALAEALFDQVKRHAGMGDWPCVLQPQDPDPDSHVGTALLVQNAPGSPAGTYRRNEDGAVLITYKAADVNEPMSLVATFAHELAHYRTAGFDEPPPGGWEVWEPATDLAASFFGFGLFLANTRFHFSQHMDYATIGWRWRQRGYLSEPELLHAHAIFCVLLDIAPAASLCYLKPSLRGICKRVFRDVRRASAALELLGNQQIQTTTR